MKFKKSNTDLPPLEVKILFFLLSLLILATALLRHEAAALIWGVMFASLFLLSTLLQFLQYPLIKGRLKRDNPHIKIRAPLFHNEPLRGNVHIPPLFVLPGFRILWKGAYRWKEGGRRIQLQLPISPVGDHILESSPCLRGDYRGRGGLYLEDMFGLVSIRLFLSPWECFKVIPSLPTTGGEGLRRGNEGAKSSSARKRILSADLFDSRPYYPGDDARKIHWKQYAAAGELMMRIGERIPPPRGRMIVELVCHSPGVQELKDPAFHTDKLILFFLELITTLISRGHSVDILLPNLETPRPYEGRLDLSLFDLFASLTAMSEGGESRGEIVLSHPGGISSGRKGKYYLKRIEARGDRGGFSDLFFVHNSRCNRRERIKIESLNNLEGFPYV